LDWLLDQYADLSRKSQGAIAFFPDLNCHNNLPKGPSPPIPRENLLGLGVSPIYSLLGFVF
jgi:hypothetical protein